tara:strand:+ start:683 stop:1048 length:366 start_codon:yes stop_codon:yes gene_type:complete
MAHPDENEEWVTSRIESWVETYKKAMLAPILLRLTSIHQPVTVNDLTTHLAAASGWHVTERGLYRTVKRLEDSGLLVSKAVDAPRTGAKRKEFSLSPLGGHFLSGISANIVELPRDATSAD